MKRVPLRSRRAPIKKKARPAAETVRVYGSAERRAWVKSLPCVYCSALSGALALVRGYSHNAHVETGGTGRKADADKIVPLCASHHRLYDEHRYPFDEQEARDYVKAWAPRIEAMWQRRGA